MKILTLLFIFISITCQAQVSPIENALLVEPYEGVLARIKSNTDYSILFNKKTEYKEIVFQLTGTDSTKEYVLQFKLVEKAIPSPTIPEVWEQVDGELATFVGYAYHGTTLATGWYNNTIAYASTAGSEVTFTFIGRQIEIWAESQKGGGSGLMSIDDGPEISMTFYSDTNKLPVRIWQSPKLISGTHKFKMRTIGNGNVLLDFFRVLK